MKLGRHLAYLLFQHGFNFLETIFLSLVLFQLELEGHKLLLQLAFLSLLGLEVITIFHFQLLQLQGHLIIVTLQEIFGLSEPGDFLIFF